MPKGYKNTDAPKKCKNPECLNSVKLKHNNYCSSICYAKCSLKGNQYSKGNILKEESKKKISEGNKGRIKSPEEIEKIKNKLKGSKHSEERVKKFSERIQGNSFAKGKKKTPEQVEKLRKFNTGRKWTEEQRKKLMCFYENQKFTWGSINNYIVNGIKCQGESEKKYIEYLLENNLPLPKRCNKFIKTPFGLRMPDFEYEDRFVEIKSEWTIKFYENSEQEIKDKWINENIKKIELLIF